ncbi:MAG: B12-binding domain-containing radical SAM protein [Clostridiaceae bacterium]
MKVVLAAVNAKYIHSNLAVRYLQAFTKDIEYDCSVNEFSINDRKEKVLEALILKKPDIVAFSCYIWNIGFVKYLSSHIKLINPKCLVIFGGPEVSYDSAIFLKDTAGDFIIEGEGEDTYREFIINYNALVNAGQDNLIKKMADLCIRGLHTKYGGNIYYGGKRKLMEMAKIVFPYNEMDSLKNKIVYYEASRGCPFECKYCLSSTVHEVRFHDVERVKNELSFFIDNNVKLIKFVDRTFNCNKSFAMSIWEFLISQNTDARFHFEISADILDADALELLRKAPVGLFQFEVGVQTTNSEVLKNISRYVNFDDIKEKVCEMERIKNIKQHLDLIAGLPGEDFESFKRSFNDVFSIRPEEIQLGFLKLLKGSKMLEEAELWGIVYSPEPPYEILKTKDISYEELISLKRVEEVLDKYYNSNKFGNIIDYFLSKYASPFNFFYDLGEFFHEKGLFGRNISSADYYKAFLDFAQYRFNEEGLLLKEIIKFDYLKYNKKKWLPDFLIRENDKEAEKILRLKINKNVHVEKYFIDISTYLKSGVTNKGVFYLIYVGEDTDIKSISAEELDIIKAERGIQ